MVPEPVAMRPTGHVVGSRGEQRDVQTGVDSFGNVFLINVPLKQPHQAIRSITWKAKSLDDAITFIELLKDGRLKALKVFSTIPWSDHPTQPCSECSVKDLVFRLEAMKDQRHLLE